MASTQNTRSTPGTPDASSPTTRTLRTTQRMRLSTAAAILGAGALAITSNAHAAAAPVSIATAATTGATPAPAASPAASVSGPSSVDWGLPVTLHAPAAATWSDTAGCITAGGLADTTTFTCPAGGFSGLDHATATMSSADGATSTSDFPVTVIPARVRLVIRPWFNARAVSPTDGGSFGYTVDGILPGIGHQTRLAVDAVVDGRSVPSTGIEISSCLTNTLVVEPSGCTWSPLGTLASTGNSHEPGPWQYAYAPALDHTGSLTQPLSTPGRYWYRATLAALPPNSTSGSPAQIASDDYSWLGSPATVRIAITSEQAPDPSTGAASLGVQVTDGATGDPLTGIGVAVRQSDGTTLASASTDPNGAVTLAWSATTTGPIHLAFDTATTTAAGVTYNLLDGLPITAPDGDQAWTAPAGSPTPASGDPAQASASIYGASTLDTGTLTGYLALLHDPNPGEVITAVTWHDTLGCWSMPLGSPASALIYSCPPEVATDTGGTRDQVWAEVTFAPATDRSRPSGTVSTPPLDIAVLRAPIRLDMALTPTAAIDTTGGVPTAPEGYADLAPGATLTVVPHALVNGQPAYLDKTAPIAISLCQMGQSQSCDPGAPTGWQGIGSTTQAPISGSPAAIVTPALSPGKWRIRATISTPDAALSGAAPIALSWDEVQVGPPDTAWLDPSQAPAQEPTQAPPAQDAPPRTPSGTGSAPTAQGPTRPVRAGRPVKIHVTVPQALDHAVHVRVFEGRHQLGRSSLLSATGSVHVRGLLPGTHRLRVSLDGHVSVLLVRVR